MYVVCPTDPPKLAHVNFSFFRAFVGVPEIGRAHEQSLSMYVVCPTDPPKLAHVNFSFFYASSATPGVGNGFLLPSGSPPLRKEPLMANQNASSLDSQQVLVRAQRQRRP